MAATAELRTNMTTRTPMKLEDRLIVALDVPTAENARRLIDTLGASVTFYKIGLQLTFAGGIALAQDLVREGKKVFLDVKLLDIDQTVANAVENIAKMGVSYLTVHGDGPAIKAAVQGRG